ncbi:hypothetical protein JIN77_16255 [Verrucomicrobiaceae bacterium R5-34]|uniref:Uncharacterized protein n=1 Tax=Oceaniferula flava TaxID=2800421 RepID=A0AAE2SDS4_9BACT|nr:hypothetical protein [Oceaniferula flavus]MBK1832292.1 hypothetical protein [Verrucomicrobiaceae bacterium R5-34]MBK1856518.1 hypothetical protein [Oceaniferula flavus]MBM1137825.1 hypothetical protein [Oceaniferula flavus]
MKKWISHLGWAISSRIAPEIVDVKTGEVLGRAFVLAFGTRAIVLGYRGRKPLVPVFLPEKKLRYWKLRIGFTTAEEPDYPNIRESL